MKVEHDKYAFFGFRYDDKKFPNKLGYVCIGAKEDEGHIFLTVAGSACSVSEPKFIPRKGIGIAKSRVMRCDPKIKRLETTMEEVKNLTFKGVMDKLELRPTCEFMDEETTEKTNVRWDGLRVDEGQERFEKTLVDLDAQYEE